MFSKVFSSDVQQIGSNNELNSQTKVIAYGPGLMMREEVFASAGTVVPMHSHYHEQITHICEGSVRVITEDGTETLLSKGEAVYIAPNEKHSVVIMEDNTVIKDAFSPVRLDHLV